MENYSLNRYTIYNAFSLNFFFFFFRNALGDGKRAIILKNNWTKVGFFLIYIGQIVPYNFVKNLFTECKSVCKNAG